MRRTLHGHNAQHLGPGAAMTTRARLINIMFTQPAKIILTRRGTLDPFSAHRKGITAVRIARINASAAPQGDIFGEIGAVANLPHHIDKLTIAAQRNHIVTVVKQLVIEIDHCTVTAKVRHRANHQGITRRQRATQRRALTR